MVDSLGLRVGTGKKKEKSLMFWFFFLHFFSSSSLPLLLLPMSSSPSFDLIGPSSGASPTIFLTCEHASTQIPSPWQQWPKEDEWIVGLHWSVDIGAELMARELAVVLNQVVTSEDREKRLNLLYHPYHNAITTHLKENPAKFLFSMHSFTPDYEGSKRKVEVGVLFTEDDTLAKSFVEELAKHGVDARLNEPWSGKEGFMHSAAMHAKEIGADALMIEVRQDLIVDPEYRAKINQIFQTSLKKHGFC